MFGKAEEKSTNGLAAILHKICGYVNAPSACPISLIQEALSFFPEKFSFHLSDRHVMNGYNGLAGIGGQGIVICCEDNAKRKIALKIAKPALNTNFVHGQSGKMRDCSQITAIVDTRFLESAKLQANIEDAARQEIRSFVIPRVHCVEEKPTPFFAMEWIQSLESLAVLKDKNDIIYSLDSFVKVLDGAQFLHEYNLVYRDFKHDNIMITDKERVVILDFGLTKEIDSRNLTMSGTPLGTLPYASLNMLRGAESANHLDDIHALGYLFWEFVTMRECPAFEGCATRIEDREKYRLAISRFLPDSCKKIFFDATTSNEQRIFQTAEEFRGAVLASRKLIQFRGRRQDIIQTEIAISNLKTPDHVEYADSIQPVSNNKPAKKMRGLTSKFLPATFGNTSQESNRNEEKETGIEIEKYKKQIEEFAKEIMDRPCIDVCKLKNLCQGKGICKYIELSQLETIKDLFF